MNRLNNLLLMATLLILSVFIMLLILPVVSAISYLTNS